MSIGFFVFFFKKTFFEHIIEVGICTSLLFMLLQLGQRRLTTFINLLTLHGTPKLDYCLVLFHGITT